MEDKNNIRNFCIIAHIDHGKSTLADRFLEVTHTVEARRMQAQYLDGLELERERGITIKMAPVRMIYRPAGQIANSLPMKDLPKGDKRQEADHSPFAIRHSQDSEFILNLIDTPGHSDFSYEVSRALEAVEGAILLVDVTQGIQAQTLANFHAAKKAGLTVIGVLNKVDMVRDTATIDAMRREVAALVSVPPEAILSVSGKTGEGVEALLDAVVALVPPPKVRPRPNPYASGRALIFDSFYDNHKGVVASLRVFDGVIKDTDRLYLVAGAAVAKPKETGYFTPELTNAPAIRAGEVGYVATGLKDPEKIKIGDTVLAAPPGPIPRDRAAGEMLHGYEEPRPVIFVSFYPENGDEYEALRQSLDKLKLNDSALTTEPDQNEVLGRGFKIGFLGRLHFEIAAERLKREFGVGVINTFPSVRYKVKTRRGEWIMLTKPEDLPEGYMEIWEPTIRAEIIFPVRFLSAALSLQKKFRFLDMQTETMGERTKLTVLLPLVELVSDFDDSLKSVTEGYGSFSYALEDYVRADIARVDLIVSGNAIPGLSRFIPKESLEREARRMVEKLKELLPRRQFTQPVQASASGRIVARADIPAVRKELGNFGKNGGDRTRKMKLWKKQQRGKKRLKERSDATISPDVFKELLKKE